MVSGFSRTHEFPFLDHQSPLASILITSSNPTHFKSGLSVGISPLLLVKYHWVNFTQCFGSLSCWKLNPFRNVSFVKGSNAASNILVYGLAVIISSTLMVTCPPVPLTLTPCSDITNKGNTESGLSQENLQTSRARIAPEKTLQPDLQKSCFPMRSVPYGKVVRSYRSLIRIT